MLINCTEFSLTIREVAIKKSKYAQHALTVTLLTPRYLSLFLCLVLSSLNVNAFETKVSADFNDLVSSIEKEEDSQKVKTKLAIIKAKFSSLSLKQQIIYYKLLGTLHIEATQYKLALNVLNEGLGKTKLLSSPSILITELLYKRGFSKESLGDFDGALQDYKQGLETAKSLNNDVFIAHGLVNIGAIYYLSDRYEHALKVLNDAYNIANKSQNEELKGDVNSELGILYGYLGQNDRAKQYYQQAYVHYKNTKKMLWAHNSLINLATINANNQNHAKAVEIYKRIITEVSEQNTTVNHDLMFSVYTGIAWSYLRLSDDNASMAYDYMLQAKQHLNYIEQFNVKLDFYSEQAYILYSLKKYDEALASIEIYEDYSIKTKSSYNFHKQTQINLIKLKAEIYYQLKDFNKAYFFSTSALSLTIALKAQEQVHSIAEVRLKLEAEQQNLQRKVLENKKKTQDIALKNTKNERTQEGYFLILISILALVFIWLLAKLIKGERLLKKSSDTDALTNLDNKNSLLKRGNYHLKQVLKKHQAFSVLLIRVDNLKEINTAYGYTVADNILKNIALTGRNMTRKSDIFGRYAGNEFIILLPASNEISTRKISARFNENLKQHIVKVNEHSINTIALTLCSGIATLAEHGSTHDKNLTDDTLLSLVNKASEDTNLCEPQRIQLKTQVVK